MNNNNLKNYQHDHMFRAMMSNKSAALDFFKQHLPQKIQQFTDFDSLQLCQETFIDEDLRKSQIDILYKANFNGNDGYFYLLTEHQSKECKHMPLRMLKYVVNIMSHHVLKLKHDKLPIVYPIVFCHNPKNYQESIDIYECFDNPELAREYLLKFQLIDMNKISDEELIANPKLFAAIQFIFKHIFTEEIMLYLKMIQANLMKLEKLEPGSILLIEMIKYVTMKGRMEDKSQLSEFIEETFSKETGGFMTTAAQLWYQEGKEEGMQAGMQAGIEKGVREMAVRMIRFQQENDLIMKFTGLSEEEIDSIRENLRKTSS